jgi:23S rRNA (cytosine1962-C5)-methyltransferase
MELKKVILSSGKDLSLKRFHPWVFSGAIKKIKNSLGKDITEYIQTSKEFILITLISFFLLVTHILLFLFSQTKQCTL